VQIREYSGEGLEQVASEFFMPAIVRTGPDFRGRSAFQELGEAVTLCRSHWEGSMSAVRTGRMAARASAGDVMVFCINLSGRCRIHQNDRSPSGRPVRAF
jgi:hypothetical protein